MATKTVVCPECDAPLSPGRFACPACGALVASVATVSRSFTHPLSVLPPPLVTTYLDEPLVPAAMAGAEDDAPLPPRLAKVLQPMRRAAPPPRAEKPAPAPTDAVIAPPAPRPQRRAPRPAVPQQTPLAWTLDEPAATAPVLAPVALPVVPPVLAPVALPVAPPVVPPAEAVEVSSLLPEPTWPPVQPESLPSSTPSSAPSWPAHPTWPPPRPANAVEPLESPVAKVVAGAYLPPSAVLPPGEALPLPGADRRDGRVENDSPRGRQGSVSTRMHLRFGEGTGPLGLTPEVPTRIVVLGAGLAGLGFLLPWANIVIGSTQIGGYLNQWGLAGPGHLAVLAGIVGLAILALLAERLPRWVRLGLPSIALAFLLIGLVWPYLVGSFDASFGVYVVAIGAIVMIAGGLLDRVATRHAEASATV